MLHLLGSGAGLGAPQHCAHHHLQSMYKAIGNMVPLARIMKWNSSAIITIFTTIKIMICGEPVLSPTVAPAAYPESTPTHTMHNAHNTF